MKPLLRLSVRREVDRPELGWVDALLKRLTDSIVTHAPCTIAMVHVLGPVTQV